MNRQIRQLGTALLVCFAALFVQLNLVQIFGAEELEDNPINTRTIIEDFGERRGDILTADGVVIATSVETGEQLARERTYPHGERYGHITGYFAFNFGAAGVEREYNDELAGRENPVAMTEVLDLLGPQDRSADVHLTIRDDLQVAAVDALGDRRGSVVAIDPRTGGLLALWSFPSFDPNPISDTDLEAAQAAWEQLNANPANPALARSYREVFAPGSTFKVVTAASALTSGRANPLSPVFAPSASYVAPLTTVPLANFGGSTCGGNLAEILRDSCNTAFAQLGAELLGPELMVDTAQSFGFNDVPPIDLPNAAASVFPTDYGAELGPSELDERVPIVENTPLLAQASIGQFDVRATPLQMALVAAAVANEGVVMTPHVMHQVISDESELVTRYAPSSWKIAFPLRSAEALRELMIGVVTDGTATSLQRAGVTVGAKTGTAQTVTGGAVDDTHAWIVAFAGPPADAPEIALAVIVEAVPGGGQQTGGTVAAPIAAAVLDAFFGGS